MKLRELIVAIQVKVNTKAAEKVDKVLGDITKHAKQTESALDGAAKSAARLDKKFSETAKSGRKAAQGMQTFATASRKAELAAQQAANAAEKASEKIERAGKKAKSAGGGFGGSLNGGGIGAALGNVAARGTALLGAGAAAGGLALSAVSERESLRETLKNLEGDADKAAETFSRIQKLAASTPFAIEEIARGVVKLKAGGLQATNEAVTAYGDLASTMGKNLDDMVEAVKDATTGENERLKEFGIKASKSGDQVSFTFKGVTTTVKANQAAIEEYLISLGKMPGVAGAMAGQMNTLRGVFSNFKDSFMSALDQAVTGSGAMEEAKGLLRDMTGAAEDGATVFGDLLTDALKSVREWIQGLTREQIKGWLENAASSAMAFFKAVVGLVEIGTKVVGFFGELIASTEAGDVAIKALTVSVTALMLAGGGLPGLFVAVGSAAVVMGFEISDAINESIGRVKILGTTLAQVDAALAKFKGKGPTGPTDAEQRQTAAATALEKVQAANRKGLGEEFFLSTQQQADTLGLSQEQTFAQNRGNVVSTEELLLAATGTMGEGVSNEAVDALAVGRERKRAGRVGVSSEAGKFLDALQTKRAKDIKTVRDRAKKKGLDEAATERLVQARRTELDARETKARKAFTDAARAKGDFDEAQKAGLAALDDKAKKGRRGKSKKDKGQDLLTALGLKGPGSILENRPAPQSLMIQTTIITKAAESIPVTINMPKGSSFEQTTEAIGDEVGKEVDAAARKQLMAIIDDAWSLRWDQLGKARGGGRVSKSAKQRGKA